MSLTGKLLRKVLGFWDESLGLFSTPRLEPLKGNILSNDWKVLTKKKKNALKKYDPVAQSARWMHWSFDMVGFMPE